MSNKEIKVDIDIEEPISVDVEPIPSSDCPYSPIASVNSSEGQNSKERDLSDISSTESNTGSRIELDQRNVPKSFWITFVLAILSFGAMIITTFLYYFNPQFSILYGVFTSMMILIASLFISAVQGWLAYLDTERTLSS